jgi:ABC-type glutathione transport system ATPase component
MVQKGLRRAARALETPMSLRALRSLKAIAHHGSFARAGEAVGLTQSAISLQVRGLEEEFGVQLFDRSRRLPVLTEAGRIVEHGPAAQIFGSPRSERTREFLQRALGDGARPRPAPAAPGLG